MTKEIEINGCVTIPMELTHNDFSKLFIEFINSNGWCFGGGTKVIIDGEYVNE